MKLMICGKGGAGKSTVTALLAMEMERRGFNVLVVDADESNLGLYRMLGLEAPRTLMADLGGKKGFQDKLKAASGSGLMAGPPVFSKGLTPDSLPKDCVAKKGNIRVVSTGKIEHFGEGCACPMGNLFRSFFSALDLSEKDLLITDTAAGLEHFGRRLDSQCDHLISIVAPSYESMTMAPRMARIAEEAGLPFSLILNNMTKQMIPAVQGELKGLDILGSLPHRPELFSAALKGAALEPSFPELSFLGQTITKIVAHT